MQLTRFDRWLRERFVYETLIYTMRPPTRLPRGVKQRKFIPPQGARFHFLYVVENHAAERELVFVLNAENQLFATKILERKTWYSRFLAPEQKSVTWWIISTILLIVAILSFAGYAQQIWADPVTQKNLLEAVEILKH